MFLIYGQCYFREACMHVGFLAKNLSIKTLKSVAKRRTFSDAISRTRWILLFHPINGKLASLYSGNPDAILRTG